MSKRSDAAFNRWWGRNAHIYATPSHWVCWQIWKAAVKWARRTGE
jgi:hypothetical protein